MNTNDFQTNTDSGIRKTFSGRLKGLLAVSVFLTGFCSIGGTVFFIRAVRDGAWRDMGITPFAWKILIFLCMLCAFIALLRIAVEERPFSKTLSACVWLIGGLFTAASILFPRLPGYQSSGFELFSGKHFVLIDGTVLMAGILLLILGSLIKAGFEMQKEMDEIL